MTEKTLYERALEITLSDANKFLKKTNHKHSCDGCGGTDLRIELDNDEKPAMTMMTLANDSERGIMLMSLTCHDCGTTRFVNAIAMARDLAGPEGGESDGR